MDDIFYEKILYRILQGRLRLKLGDLVLYIHDPSKDILEESIDIYEEAYKKAYFCGVPIKNELLKILIENELWTPFDDREADKIEKQIEDLKLEAYKNYYDSKKLSSIKYTIRQTEKRLFKYKAKKLSLDHTSCEGVANFSRSVWIISKTAFYADKTPYDWKQYTISAVMDKYNESQITQEQFRKIARTDPWRSMWAAGKKQGNVFGKPTSELTPDQLSLVSFSYLYDNVFESHECPNEKIINDDDCLDGWLISQRRESEKHKKEKEVNAMLKNPKIANSQEVFIVAKDQESAQEIYGLNSPHSMNIIKNRSEKIKNADGSIKFTEFDDIKQDIAIQSHQKAIQQIKGRAR
jgi:hypothetical protein